MLQYELKMWYRTGLRIGNVEVLDFWDSWFKCQPRCQLSWGSVRFSSVCTGKCQASIGLQALIRNSEIPKICKDWKIWPTALTMQVGGVSCDIAPTDHIRLCCSLIFYSEKTKRKHLSLSIAKKVKSLRKLDRGCLWSVLYMMWQRSPYYRITFLKSEKFWVPKHIWPLEFRIRDCGLRIHRDLFLADQHLPLILPQGSE